MKNRKRNFNDQNDRSEKKKQKRFESFSFDPIEPIRFDFPSNSEDKNFDEEKEKYFQEKLFDLKTRLNQVKSLLNDFDLDEWSRHTHFLNVAGKIVGHLRENFQIELGTQAWAKFYEILCHFDLVNCQNENNWKSLHLCEAPGGFISALNHFLASKDRTKFVNWQWFGQTLNPYFEHDSTTNSMLINDDRLIFESLDENRWDFGSNNSGNILDEINKENYVRRFEPMLIELVTADGSFDVQNEPAEQENLVFPLIKSEIEVGLGSLRDGGNFLIKIFTTFEEKTVEIVFLLFRSFDSISFFKPTTSKRGNSEIYVVCRKFFRSIWLKIRDETKPKISTFFREKIDEASRIFANFQIETIEKNFFLFSNQNRSSRKNLYRAKEKTLKNFLERCEIAPLDEGRTRIFTEKSSERKIFLSRSKKNFSKFENFSKRNFSCPSEEFCSICTKIDEFFDEKKIFDFGEIFVEETKIEFVFGRRTTKFESSPFCDVSMLKISRENNLVELKSIIDEKFSSTANEENSSKLVEFARKFNFDLKYEKNVFSIRSDPILTRLDVSVIYVLAENFEKTTISVVLEPIAHLLFQFHQEKSKKIVEIENRQDLIQFVSFRQLFDENFVSKLIHANNLCLQMRFSR